MNQRQTYIAILFLMIACSINFGCSTCKLQNENPKIDITTSEMSIWLDLMPGGPARFHFAGAVQIKNNTQDEVENFELSEVVVKSDDLILYRISPESDFPLKIKLEADGEDELKFYSPQNIKAGPQLNKIDSLNVILKFSTKQNERSFDAGKFKLDRTY
ncbi:MAG: hypothetical protein K8H86_11800 [Ignavibacteriaceae bacterium]|nr:hypothetical protein [Ignavibacteriaceae bacterium]